MLPGLFEYEPVAVTLSTVLLLEWLLGLPDECWTPGRGFTVLTMGYMKTLVFWVVILCIVHLVQLFQRNMLVSSGWKEEAGTRFLQNVRMLSDCKVLHPRSHNCCLEDRVSKFLWNVSTYYYVSDYTVAYPRNVTSFTPKVESAGFSKILVCFSWKTIMLIFFIPLHVVKDCDFGCWHGSVRGNGCEIRNCANICFICLQSDSDDVLSAGIHRQLVPLTRKTRPITQLHGNIESDSFNENFSPVHPNTRRYCKCLCEWIAF